ncbi:unnamed protein product [Diatraea saccharalis]|uniref:glycerophosphodiester phosphodiesterase n=1 Tax=Diatraea saccharalis TaxID=40085 RepID=A0A9N9N281_9NEOP|nr:unnamed protein product [Diatraea saccharalis]
MLIDGLAWLLAGFSVTLAVPVSRISKDETVRVINECNPLVIGHRGASGYVPEHTLGSYALAITLGTDYVEPDLVMTKDGHLIARHDNELGLTTDVSEHTEFASRHKNKTVDGKEIEGWFTEDCTLEEIKTLRAVERIPGIRPGNARLNGAFTVPTFQEIINLVKSLQVSQSRTIGIYPEIKHSTHFKNLGLPMERAVVDILHKNDYQSHESPIYIQSFEITNLKELKEITNLRLLQLYESDFSMQPYDQVVAGTGYTYGDMSTPQGLKEVAKYAYAVGPDKTAIIPRDSNNRLGVTTNFVHDAHAAGLKVHPYTFRAENTFLPAEFRSSTNEDDVGDLSSEIRAYLNAGIDGLFSDQPDIPVRVRKICK